MNPKMKLIGIVAFVVLITSALTGAGITNLMEQAVPDAHISITLNENMTVLKENPPVHYEVDLGNELTANDDIYCDVELENKTTVNDRIHSEVELDYAPNETAEIIVYIESPYEKIYVTPDSVSAEEEYSGTIEIVAGIPYCNCTGVTKVYVDGYYQVSGKYEGHLDWAYDTYRHILDLKLFEEGEITIQVLGKHDEIINEFTIVVDNFPDAETEPDDTIPANSIPQVVLAPIGESLCLLNHAYTYTFIGYDSDEDNVWYAIDWGDGKTVEGPFEQGVLEQVAHTWKQAGTYEVRYKANDGYGGVSDWSASLCIKVVSPHTVISVSTQYQESELSFDFKTLTVSSIQQVNFFPPTDLDITSYSWYKDGILISNGDSIAITSQTNYRLNLCIGFTSGSAYSSSISVLVI